MLKTSKQQEKTKFNMLSNQFIYLKEETCLYDISEADELKTHGLSLIKVKKEIEVMKIKKNDDSLIDSHLCEITDDSCLSEASQELIINI